MIDADHYGDSTDHEPLPPSTFWTTKKTNHCCCCRMTKRRILWLTGTIIALLITAILIMFFVGGKALAQQQIENSDIVVTMSLTSPVGNTFKAHVTGYMDNRGTFGATLDAATIQMFYRDVLIGDVPFPKLQIAAGKATPLDIWSTITVTNPKGLELFGADLLTQANMAITLKANLGAETMGFRLNNINLEKAVQMTGFNNFADPPLKLDGMPKVLATTPLRMTMELRTEMYNSASVSFGGMGVLALKAYYKGVEVGIVSSVSNDTSILFGRNVIEMEAVLSRNENNSKVMDELFGNYVSGQTTNLTMLGYENTTSVELLKPALRYFNISVPFPGLVNLQDKMISGGYAKIPPLAQLERDPVLCWFRPGLPLLKIATDVYVFANNPLNATLQLTEFNVNATWDGVPDEGIPSMPFAEAREKVNIIVPPLSQVVTKSRLCLAYSNQLLGNLFPYIGRQDTTGVVPFFLYVSFVGKLVGNVGGFAVNLDYEQQHVAVTTHAAWTNPSSPTTHSPTTHSPTTTSPTTSPTPAP